MTKAVLLICMYFSCADDDMGTFGTVNLKRDVCFDKFESDVRIYMESIIVDSRCQLGVFNF